MLNGIRYQYGFEYDHNQIHSEWLLVYNKAKPQRWFERNFDPETHEDKFSFSSHFTGPTEIWRQATRKDRLFLPKAVENNSHQLKPLYDWFNETLVSFNLDNPALNYTYSTQQIKSEESKQQILSFLKGADFSITDIVVKREMQTFPNIMVTPSSVTVNPAEVERDIPKFQHEVEGISSEFDLKDESQGTQKLFALAGPILDIIKNGKILIVDELNNSLHPLLMRHIINKFHDPELNKNGAQLIFTTHDPSLLDETIFRRDQILLMEKRADQSSELISLANFSPRKGEALEKNYLSGRYGAIPIL